MAAVSSVLPSSRTYSSSRAKAPSRSSVEIPAVPITSRDMAIGTPGTVPCCISLFLLISGKTKSDGLPPAVQSPHVAEGVLDVHHRERRRAGTDVFGERVDLERIQRPVRRDDERFRGAVPLEDQLGGPASDLGLPGAR